MKLGNIHFNKKVHAQSNQWLEKKNHSERYLSVQGVSAENIVEETDMPDRDRMSVRQPWTRTKTGKAAVAVILIDL